MPGRTRGSTSLSRMRVANPLMLFLIVACGAMRSTTPITFRPGTASTWTSTSWPCLSRVTSAWLTWALMIMSFRLAMVSTSVPLLKPAEPETAWPDRHRPRQDRAVERRQDAGLAQLVFDQAQRLFRPVQGVLGEFELGAGVVEELLGNQFLGEQLLAALEVPAGLFQLQPRTSISISRCERSICRSRSSSGRAPRLS